MQYKNVHSHIFTMNNAPDDFLNLYLPGALADALKAVTDTKGGSWFVQQVLKLAGNGGKRYASFLRIGKSSAQQDIFENLINQYDDTNMQFVALTMYMEKLGAGPSASGFEGQIEEIINVKKQYPDRLKIFMGVDPRWKSTGAELRDTIKKYFDTQVEISATRKVYPFCGLKLYPSTGFYIFDARLKETLEWAADNNVPVLAHCNYLGGIYNNDENYLKNNLDVEIPKEYYTNSTNPDVPAHYSDYCKAEKLNSPGYIKKTNAFKWLLGTNGARNNKYSCSYFLEPASYKLVLNYFDKVYKKPLKLCLAHFGGDEQIKALLPDAKPDQLQNSPFGTDTKNWHKQILDILNNHPSAYTDISYAVFDTNIHDTFLDEVKTDIGNRMMFGTDYFLTEQEQPEKDTYNNFRNRAIKCILPDSGISAWDAMAGLNIDSFLKSKYC